MGEHRSLIEQVRHGLDGSVGQLRKCQQEIERNKEAPWFGSNSETAQQFLADIVRADIRPAGVRA